MSTKPCPEVPRHSQETWDLFLYPCSRLFGLWPLRHSGHGNSDADLPGIANTLTLPVADALGWCAAVEVVHVYMTCAGSSPSNTRVGMAEELDGDQQHLSSLLIPDMSGKGTENKPAHFDPFTAQNTELKSGTSCTGDMAKSSHLSCPFSFKQNWSVSCCRVGAFLLFVDNAFTLAFTT